VPLESVVLRMSSKRKKSAETLTSRSNQSGAIGGEGRIRMNEFPEGEGKEQPEGAISDRPPARIWPAIIIVALIVVAGLAIVYAHSQRSEIDVISARDTSLNASVAQLHSQLQSTTAKLNDMVAQQQAAAQAAVAEQEKKQAVARHSATRARVSRRHELTASEKRYNALQARIDAQQKELDQTNQSVAQTRSDLQANLDSARNDLNGSIAKNHDELVALEKRGQRNFYEFDLLRSKEFSRSGPISLSLRHADTKHMRYNVMLLVDDNRLEKKNVDLYEPIWISSADEPQPLEIVVNKITKNHIHGYVSAAKYSSADLASGGASLKPVSAISSGAGNSNRADSAPAGSETQSAPAQRSAPTSVQP
jgi:hypothetical protein